MPIASVNGLELNYQLEGDGPTPLCSSTASPTTCGPGTTR